MSGPPTKRRRTKAIGPDSVEFAKAFTHKTITTTNRSGIVVKKDVLVPLVPDKPIAASSSTNLGHNDNTTQEYDEYMYGNDYDKDEGISNQNKTKVSV